MCSTHFYTRYDHFSIEVCVVNRAAPLCNEQRTYRRALMRPVKQYSDDVNVMHACVKFDELVRIYVCLSLKKDSD
jgi:hypothetical protein